MQSPSSPTVSEISSMHSVVEKGSMMDVPLNNQEKQPSSDSESAPEFPDGGLHAWLTVFGAASLLFGTFGIAASYGVFQAYYEETLSVGTPNSLISFVGAFQVCIVQFGGIFVGHVWDTTGLKYLLPFSAASALIALFTLSICQPGANHFYQILLSQAVLFGIASCMAFSIALAICSHWFAKKRGTAMGIVVAGSSLGGIFIPLIFTKVLSVAGFGWAVRTIACITALCYIIAFLTLRTRLPFKKTRPLSHSVDLSAFKDWAFVLMSIGSLFLIAGFPIPYFYMEVFANYYGVNPNIAKNLVTISNAAGFFGRISSGMLGDKFGKFNSVIPIALCCSLLCFLPWTLATGNGAALIVFAIFFGALSGSIVSLTPAAIVDISPRERVGARLGTHLAIVSIGSVTGPVIAGMIGAQLNPNSIRGVTLFSGSLFAVGSIFIIAARMSLTRSLTARR
ncbi:MFS general substrate transporter [Sistotremastrum suecicum HHB10207 ss-3]|uniref:MFS general substrate transporter n=1 Tax=Sistotremastrum suecicum HHB10207 ss-3 TaxID=1314776 RepID=A0A166F0Y5_9AGAM|nr:MFS general substrate transporter [Sistotremastrum suecicum HHB10207 ss-3]